MISGISDEPMATRLKQLKGMTISVFADKSVSGAATARDLVDEILETAGVEVRNPLMSEADVIVWIRKGTYLPYAYDISRWLDHPDYEKKKIIQQSGPDELTFNIITSILKFLGI